MARKKNNIRINEKIKAKEVRLINEEDENLGVMPIDEALEKAEEADLDLIEIAPKGKPPVVRIMDYDKYRYNLEKQRKKERQAQKGSEMKRVQISARAAEHDLQTRLKQLEKFLAEGHPVEIQMRLFGREKRNKDWARKKMQEFLDMIESDYKVTQKPRFGGWGMIAQIAKQ